MSVFIQTAGVSGNAGSHGEDEIYLNDGDDQVVANSTLTVQHVYGGEGNDPLGELDDVNDVKSATLFGGDGDDVIEGGLLGDIMFGENGDDTITAKAGPNDIDGGLGADHLFGADDNDLIDGGAGNDVIFGGGAND